VQAPSGLHDWPCRLPAGVHNHGSSAAGRYFWGAENYILNQFFPDGSPARDESLLQSYTTRITANLSSKHKVTALYDPLPKHRDYFLSETGLYDLKGAGVQNM
jgi:hypothetical protein